MVKETKFSLASVSLYLGSHKVIFLAIFDAKFLKCNATSFSQIKKDRQTNKKSLTKPRTVYNPKRSQAKNAMKRDYIQLELVSELDKTH